MLKYWLIIILLFVGINNGFSQKEIIDSVSANSSSAVIIDSLSISAILADSILTDSNEFVLQADSLLNKDSLNIITNLANDKDSLLVKTNEIKRPQTDTTRSFFSDKGLKSKATFDTSAVIYSWILDEQFINPEKVEMDTDLYQFQVFSPVILENISISSTGDYGRPYITNNFFKRDYHEDLFYLNSFTEYFTTYNNALYYNTRKPYTLLKYINGVQDKRSKEEIIELFHTQNINPKLNFGFNFAHTTNKGRYRYQLTKLDNFRAFSSYNGRNYTLYGSANVNRYYGEESGGLNDSIFRNVDNMDYLKLYATNYNGATETPYAAYTTNKIRYIDALVSQRLKLFTIGGKSDTTGTKSMAEPVLSHTFLFRRSSKLYEESSNSDPKNPFYSKTYVNPLQTFDSLAEFKVSNKIQLDFTTKIRGKVTTGIFGAIGHDLTRYSYYSLLDSMIVKDTLNKVFYDTLGGQFYYYFPTKTDSVKYYIYKDDTIQSINRNDALTNVYIAGGIYGKFWTNFQSKFTAKLYLAGYKAGETRIDGYMLTRANILSKPYFFSISGAIENLKPSYLLNNYYSNYYIWENDFSFINRLSLSSKIASPSNKFELSGNYTLIRNYIYFTDSTPTVAENPINLMGLSLEKEFAVWKLHFFNRLHYQVSESVVQIPKLIYYGSAYFDNTWTFKLTGGKLQTMVGVDLSYTSLFYGYTYSPSWAIFYQQDERQIGNYPYVDIWGSIKLKQTRFFFKYQHLNTNFDAWKRKDYYSAINYPAYPGTFIFGISWAFYD
ncbi:MAG: hypothetical protein JXA77_15870 [Bacteroidales bacterium]|nr:hypothetical protein [Bacteroidales bacterium]MBN2817462.1 hypothetical protein [Bacteroidales bacterium]